MNEGWSFEGPDPEAGIFTDTVVHEDCPLWDEHWLLGAEATSDTRFLANGPDLVDMVTTWTCQCGATTETRDTQPRDYFEERA